MPNALSLAIVRPEIPQMELAVLQRRPGIRIDEGRQATVEWTVRGDDGKVVDLSTVLVDQDVPSAGVSYSGSSLVPSGRAEARIREPLTDGPDATFTIAATSHDPAKGIVRFDMPAEAVTKAKVMLVNVAIFDANDRLLTVSDGVIIIDRSIFGAEYKRVGVPTVDEVRLKLRDSGINDNFLLARLEYSLGELGEAMIQAVAFWNRIGGPNTLKYTTETFPDPDTLLDGVVAFLYEMTAHNYRRNSLQYQAAGVAVNDKGNYQEYDKIGQTLMDSFRRRAAKTIAREVRTAWTGTLGSPYGGRVW